MDFGKAFDKVNHSLLIHKLRYYEIDGKTTRWIQNWLEDRQQTVVLDGVSSEAVSVDWCTTGLSTTCRTRTLPFLHQRPPVKTNLQGQTLC